MEIIVFVLVLTFPFLFVVAFLGDVLFYRNKKGEAVRRPSEEYRVESKSE